MNSRHRDFQSRALPTELPVHAGTSRAALGTLPEGLGRVQPVEPAVDASGGVSQGPVSRPACRARRLGGGWRWTSTQAEVKPPAAAQARTGRGWGGRALPGNHEDDGAVARGGGKSAIGGDERRIEYLGEREVDRVGGRDVGPQLPHARQQDVVRVAPDV